MDYIKNKRYQLDNMFLNFKEFYSVNIIFKRSGNFFQITITFIAYIIKYKIN